MESVGFPRTMSERPHPRVDTSYRTKYTGKDPDSHDPTLRDFHLALWSKRLPNGAFFNLTANPKPPFRLCHRSELGDFTLSSDAITHTYSKWKSGPMPGIIRQIAKEDIAAFFDLGCSIGGYSVFPANKIGDQATINQYRGTNAAIKDRFDLTLECIRRWYLGEGSPLYDCLDRYGDFFRLFTDFKGYAGFFLLDDLTTPEGKVRFWLPFRDFGVTSPLPQSKDEYLEYMKNVSAFLNARNRRIEEWCRAEKEA